MICPAKAASPTTVSQNPHQLRNAGKTVATRLDEAGLTPRQVADQLGHANPSMTLDIYFGRQVVSAEAALVLDR